MREHLVQVPHLSQLNWQNSQFHAIKIDAVKTPTQLCHYSSLTNQHISQSKLQCVKVELGDAIIPPTHRSIETETQQVL